MKRCMKHPEAEATRTVELGGDTYFLCADCAWKALLDGYTLKCLDDGRRVHLDESQKPVFEEVER